MKKIISSILLALAMVISFLPASAYAEGETVYPVVNSMSLGSESVIPGGTQIVTLNITSTVSIKHVIVEFYNSTTMTTIKIDQDVTDTKLSGDFAFDLVMGADQALGKYTNTSITVTDNNSNTVTYAGGGGTITNSQDNTKSIAQKSFTVLAAADTTAPTISQMSFQSSKAEQNSSAKINYTFTEDGSGMSSFEVVLQKEDNAGVTLTSGVQTFDPAITSGTKTVSVNIPSGTAAGNYDIAKVTVRDVAGNETVYTIDNNDATKKISAIVPTGNYITVLAEGEYIAPLVTNIKYSKSSINRGDSVDVTFTVVNSNVGISDISVTASYVIDNEFVGNIQKSVSYTPRNFNNEITLTLDTSATQAPGNYSIVSLTITNNDGAKRWYNCAGSGPLTDQDNPNVVLQQSEKFTVIGSGTDETAPVISSLSTDVLTVDKGSAFTINYHVTEDESGVSQIHINLAAYDSKNTYLGDMQISASYSGDPKKTGNYSISYTVPTDQKAATYSFTNVEVIDANGNDKQYQSDYLTKHDVCKNTLIVNSDGDDTAPVINSIKIITDVLIRPDVAVIEMDITETGKGLESILTGIAITGSQDIQYEKRFDDSSNDKSQVVTLRIPISDTNATGNYKIDVIDIKDKSGNMVRYSNYDNDLQISSICSDNSINVIDEFKNLTTTSLSNPDLINVIRGTGNAGVIRIEEDQDIVPAEVFQTMLGTQKTIIIYKEGIEWILQAADLDKNNIKQIDTSAKIEVVYGDQLGSSNNVVKLVFPDNGTLPAKVRMRLKLAYLNTLYNMSGGLQLYFNKNGTLEPENADFNMTSDNLVEFTLTHNSTYFISSGSLSPTTDPSTVPTVSNEPAVTPAQPAVNPSQPASNPVVDTLVEKNDMYRLYNPNSGEHFFTANTEERDYLASIGWSYEGVAWTAPKTSNTPVYRLYNGNGGEHHYTTSMEEANVLTEIGWSLEGIGWYSDDAQEVPLYRMYNPNAYANNHHYTTSEDERDYLVSLGWNYEGTGWYGMN